MYKFDFMSYMLDCATRLKEISHSESEKRFFRISDLYNLDEFLFNLPDAKYPAMLVLDDVQGNFADRSKSDNYVDIKSNTFIVVADAPFNDHDKVEEVKESCKAIGLKIIARMIHEKRNMLNGLIFLDTTSIVYTTVGPIADNVFGVMFSFKLTDQLSTKHNPEDWIA